MKLIPKIFKPNHLKRYWKDVEKVNNEEKKYKAQGKEQLLEHSKELKKRANEGTALEEILPDAFALVREAARRTLGQRHYDVQLIGGMVLHEGRIAEMLTGEGKTLAATLAVYLNALAGKGVHVITVNDYLAKRDTVWMGQVYQALGLSVACISHDASYRYDPEYEGSELDEKRDQLGSFKVMEKFLRPMERKEAYEADITYGTNHEFGFDYLRDNLAMHTSQKVQRPYHYAIIDEIDSILIDEARTPLIISAPDKESSGYYKTFAKVVSELKKEVDYIVDEKLRTVNATDEGIEKVEKRLQIKNIFDPKYSRLVHFLNESLKAKALFERDKHYVVQEGEIIIVDEFTGRMLPGRRYSGGLHQAIEAKENVQVKEENRTFATITIQNFFKLYQKLAGMTGTAETSAEEFHKVYNINVVSIPPNEPVARNDMPDIIYKDRPAKYRAVAVEVKKRSEAGQPILMGTGSITNNEVVSSYLKKAGVPHEVLNAKNHEREGEVIAQAGKPGAVTVATNIAGRGVDIVLGGNPATDEDAKRVREAGGLHVLGTERHDARRIDNQLRGRSGRQGDPGSSQFFLSLEDDLLRIFGGERIQNLMKTFNFPEDQPIESKMVSKSVNQAQARVEGANFDLRKHLLDFDDVLNRQRTAIYEKRSKILEAGEKNTADVILNEVKDLKNIPNKLEPLRAQLIAQNLIRVADTLWVNHLEDLESLRQSVNIRAYAQHEPLVEYRREAHELYQAMQESFKKLAAQSIPQLLELDLSKIIAQTKVQSAPPPEAKKLGRNDPCYCGSGKKYKKCHGK
jgi:preprotein translocase subunit SecA